MLCDHRLGIEGPVPESEPLVKGDAIDFTVDKSAEPGDLLGSLAELLIGLAEEKNELDDQAGHALQVTTIALPNDMKESDT